MLCLCVSDIEMNTGWRVMGKIQACPVAYFIRRVCRIQTAGYVIIIAILISGDSLFVWLGFPFIADSILIMLDSLVCMIHEYSITLFKSGHLGVTATVMLYILSWQWGVLHERNSELHHHPLCTLYLIFSIKMAIGEDPNLCTTPIRTKWRRFTTEC